MVKVKQTVKTEVEIRLDTMDIKHAIEHYLNTPIEKTVYPKAFNKVNLSYQMNELDIINVMINFICEHGDTFGYLASYFGFDDWCNSGTMDRQKNIYKMTVFSYGDQIN